LFKRIFRSFVQLVGVVGIGFAVLAGILFWRLATGPISLSFLNSYFEDAFNVSDNNFQLKLQDTVLTWIGKDQNLGIKLQNIKALAPDGKIIAKIPELAITLSGAALLKGQLAPRSIIIFGPSLNIVRTEFGKLELGITQFMSTSGDAESKNQDLVARIIEELFSPMDKSQPLGYLRRIDIVNLDVAIDDRKLDVKWSAPKTIMSLIRKEDIVSVSAELALKPINTLIEELAVINLKGNYDLEKNEVRLTVGFSDLNPVVFAPISRKFEVLKSFDLPLSGNVDLVILSDGNIESFEFNLSGGQGRIAILEPVQVNANVKGIEFLGKYRKELERLKIEKLTLDLGKDGVFTLPSPIDQKFEAQRVSLMGDFDFSFARFTLREINLFTKDLTVNGSVMLQDSINGISFEFDGKVNDVSIRQILSVWPRGSTEIAREWVAKNVDTGFIPSARVKLKGIYNKKRGFEIAKILGTLDYQNMTVNYFSPLPRATDGKGKIKFNHKRLDIEIKHGNSDGLLIRNGHIIITGLDKIDQYMDVYLEVDGAMDSAIKLANTKPFEIVNLVGFNTNRVSGSLSSKIKLNFLLEKDITLDKVRMSSEAVLKNIHIPKIALNMDLTNGDLIFNADNKGMMIKGSGQIAGVGAKFEWHKDFNKESRNSHRYRIMSKFDDKSWREKLKLNFPPFNKTYINGVMGVDITANVGEDGSGELKAELDLNDALITLPRMGWYKPGRVAAFASVSAKFSGEKFKSVSKITFKGGGLNLDANASFADSGELKQVAINRLQFGQTDVQAILAPNRDVENGGWNIHVSGKQLDLIDWIAGQDIEIAEEKGEALTLSLNLDSIQLYSDRKLFDVSGIISFDGWVWHRINLKSGLGVNKALEVSLVPKNGKRYLYVSSNDAGLILKTFDYYDNVIGGKLSLRGEYHDMSPDSKFSGRARIDDFRVIKAPILAKLLNVASVTGIVDELLGGVGIGFAKLDAPFESKNDIIKVKDASVSGVSLGMTATGLVNTIFQTLNLKGTIVPAYLLNTALTRIPIVGKIFSGGEKDGGVFAANYTMEGDVKEPDISTNPLSVLAPGLLRQLFKIFNKPNKEKTNN